MFRPFCHTIVVPGTLAAAIAYAWTAPMDCTLQHVSMVQSNAGNGRVKIGTSADDDIFLTYTDMGLSGTPVEISAPAGGFRYAATPRIKKGDIVKLNLDHDGASGTAAADACIVLTFEEG